MPAGLFPPSSKYREELATLQRLADQGDVETRNALALLIPPTRHMVEVADKSGTPLVNGLQRYLDALDLVANRCKLVGSSALQ